MQVAIYVLGVAYTIVYLVGVILLCMFAVIFHTVGECQCMRSVTLTTVDNLQCGRAPAVYTLNGTSHVRVY